MKRWKQLTKTVLASVMALAMVVVGNVNVAMATPGVTEGGTAANPVQGILRKNLEVAPGVSVPAKTFEYTVTRVSRNGVTNVDLLPEITGVKIEFDGNETLDTSSSTLTDYDGFGIATQVSADMFASKIFPVAGEYVYEIVEVEDTTDTTITNWSPAKYEMKVFVMNVLDVNNIPTGTTYVEAVSYTRKIADRTGETTGGKADPNFTNRYEPEADLLVSKTVKGESADTSEVFQYTLILTKLSGAVSASSTTYPITKSDGTADTVEFIAGGATATVNFTLKHGEELLIEGLPAGTTYTLQEVAATGYSQEVEVVMNGATPISRGSTTDWGNSLTVGAMATSPLDAPVPLGEDNNEVHWINHRQTISPTGILINNLPYILLIVVAIGGFAGYIVSKRKQARR